MLIAVERGKLAAIRLLANSDLGKIRHLQSEKFEPFPRE
jgi:hypothetical protein